MRYDKVLQSLLSYVPQAAAGQRKMVLPLILSAACAMALLAMASIRRVPQGHVYAFRRMDGRVRIVRSGTHLVLPLVERVARRISLAGSAVPVEGLERNGLRQRATVYFQVLDPDRAGAEIDRLEDRLATATRRLYDAPGLPDAPTARPGWLKQGLNAELRERGLLVARVDLASG